MPRLFFHVRDAVGRTEHKGRERPDWRDARHAAVPLAAALIADGAERLRLGEDWAMDVADAAGLVLFRLDVHGTGSAAIAGGTRTGNDPA